jgi:iron complex outermembrane receptor protein
MRVIRVVCTALAALFLITASASAQSASLTGRVVDPDGAAVANAAVVLMPLPSGASQTQVTGGDGSFRFTGLRPGEYRVEVTSGGFSLHAQTLMLTAGERAMTVELDIAPVSEEITVEGVATVPTIGRIPVALRDQPLTVHTLTADYLQSRAINDVVTALNHLPNVVAYNQYGVYQYFTFRGINDSVQMVDGIRNEGNRVSTQLAGVDRVEVLMGPASVLYGADAIGGTVNLVLKKPTAYPTYDFTAAAGRWETYRGSFGAGGRVGDVKTLFYRLDVGGESAENFRHDPARRLNVTPSIMWRPAGTRQLEVRYMFDRNRVSGDSGIPLVPLVADFTADPTRTAIGDPLSRAVQGDGSDFIPKVARDVRFNTPQDFGLGTDQNLRVSYSQTFGGAYAFRNTAGYRDFDDEYWVAEFLDVTPPSRVNRGFLYFKHHRRPFTNQAELSGRVMAGVPHDLLVGWDFQEYDNYTHRRAAANFNTTPMDLYNPVETHAFVDLDSFPVTRVDYSTNRTHGVFVQDALTLAPQLKVVVGGRFDRIRRQNYNNPFVNGVETQAPVIRGESDKFTHRAGVVYQPTTAIDIYAQNSTSFRPNFNVQPDGSLLKPEYGEQYEVGQRLRMMQERLQLSAALFHMQKRNLTRSLGGGFFEQIGKLRSRGFETELTGVVTPEWNVQLGYGYTHARFLEYIATGGANLSGRIPRRAPEHTVSFSTSYVWPSGLSAIAGGRVVSRQFLNDINTVSFHGYELLDLGVAYRRGRVQYTLNLTNVTDREYFASSLGNRQLYPGQPFNVMAAIRVRTP